MIHYIQKGNKTYHKTQQSNIEHGSWYILASLCYKVWICVAQTICGASFSISYNNTERELDIFFKKHTNQNVTQTLVPCSFQTGKTHTDRVKLEWFIDAIAQMKFIGW